MLEDVVARLSSFPDGSTLDPVIRVRIGSVDRPSDAIPRPAGRAWRLFEAEYAFEYFPSADLLYLAEPGVVARCDPTAGSIEIALVASDRRARFVASHLFFSLLLLEILKRRGRYGIHAAAVALDGRAALLPGPAGSGKSTLAFASLRAGFAFLGDDLALLSVVKGRLRLHAFPDAIELASDTTRFFPDLADLFPDPAPGAPSAKRPFHPSDRGLADLVWDTEPATLLFPTIVAPGADRITPISVDDAFLRLIPNVVRTDPQASQAHLDALAALARLVPAFALDFADPLAVPAVIRERLATPQEWR